MASEPSSDGATHDPMATWRRQINNIIETQISRSPFLFQSRAVWRQLQDERESWPLLLPLVALFFYLVYRRERKFVAAVVRDMAD